MKYLIAFVVLACGCAGPSRAQYAELLHECREANSEHLRMIREYEKKTDEFLKGCTPLPPPYHGWGCANDGVILAAPEQSHGAAEMGLGGF